MLEQAPLSNSFLFISYNETGAAADARWMRDQLAGTARALRLPPSRTDTFFRRAHFATVPVSRVYGWLPAALEELQHKQKVAKAS